MRRLQWNRWLSRQRRLERVLAVRRPLGHRDGPLRRMLVALGYMSPGVGRRPGIRFIPALRLLDPAAPVPGLDPPEPSAAVPGESAGPPAEVAPLELAPIGAAPAPRSPLEAGAPPRATPERSAPAFARSSARERPAANLPAPVPARRIFTAVPGGERTESPRSPAGQPAQPATISPLPSAGIPVPEAVPSSPATSGATMSVDPESAPGVSRTADASPPATASGAPVGPLTAPLKRDSDAGPAPAGDDAVEPQRSRENTEIEAAAALDAAPPLSTAPEPQPAAQGDLERVEPVRLAGQQGAVEAPGSQPAIAPSEASAAPPPLPAPALAVAQTPGGATQRVDEQRQARRRAVAPRPSPTAGRPPAAESAAASRPVEPTRSEEPSVAQIPPRSLEDWRRLLFEATSPPPARPASVAHTAPRAPVPPVNAPGKATPATLRPASRSSAPGPRPAARLVEPPIANAPGANALAAKTPGESIPARRLSEPARRFLRPLVGFDPDTAHVHQSPEATAALGASGAAAATVDDTIVLPAEAEERTPAGLGLVAHELTHAVRARRPGFLPPIVRAPAPSSRSSAASPRGIATSGSEYVGADEEQVARTVESRVRGAAAEEQRAAVGVVEADADSAPIHAFAAPWPATESGERAWNGLPAPWEPLPALPEPPAGGVTTAAGASPVASQVVHFADADRDAGPAAPAAPDGAGAPPAPPSAPKPDLDALARQVYDVLKRRLAAERRREGSWGAA